TNEITATVTDPQDPGLGSFVSHIFFAVSLISSTAPYLTLTLNSVQYYGGDPVTATWEMGGLNANATQGWAVGHWYAYEENGADTMIAWGFLNSTAVTGTFGFTAPVTFGGTIYIYLGAFNSSDTTSTAIDAVVTAPTILLNPSEAYYLPGDSVTVQVTTEGAVFSSTTLYATVTADSGYQLVSGVLSGNQIQFTVPKVAAPSYIEISVAAQSTTLGIVAAARNEISEGSGFQLQVGVNTKSNYADGSFQPGQTIQLSYNLISVGQTTSLPRNLNVYIYPGSTYYFGSSYGAIIMETNAPSGTFSYTIPSGTPAGDQSFTVYVESVICGEGCQGAENSFGIFVEPSPSVLSMDVGGAGSGLTVGWLVLLVVVIVVAIVLLLVIRRRGGSRSSPPAAPVQPYSATPATDTSTGSSSSSSPPSWQGSGGSGGSASSPPPMPQPPTQ
ncbi:MAG: hypothetical protein L3K17_04470, partial [Thermoplasmata archaeon]|nr:hypothetical protein [Thermoplasmata archaeon]